MKVVAPLKNNEKNPSLLSMLFINKFDESRDTFGEGKKNLMSSTKLGYFAWKKQKQQAWGRC
jgi:hypothetical protein